MSKKEYDISYNEYTKTYTVKESEPYEWTPSSSPTLREKLGKKMVSLSRGKKIFWTLFFGIYGFLYRLGSNNTFSFIFSIVQLFTFNLFGLFWLIDIISVLVKNDIVVFGRVEYKDYIPRP